MSDDSNPQAGQGRPLPKKEQDKFREVVKQYECKQYKKGLKSCDAILKKFPRHGETLCMKGLILNAMTLGKNKNRDEAIQMVKLGLMNDMRSHVCWHVYGLIYRAERNYNEAIKAYKQALKIDTHNIQILRDLSLLQIQMRDLPGFAKTRHAILELNPNQKTNWLTFALSKHLCGDVDEAINVIDIYLDTLDTTSKEFQCNYESSELALYKNMLICEQQQQKQQSSSDNIYKVPYEHLKSIQHLIKDQYSYLKQKAYYQLQLQLFDEAKQTYIDMFNTFGSTEDYHIHSGYMISTLASQLDNAVISSFYTLLHQSKSSSGTTTTTTTSSSSNSISSLSVSLSGARTIATILPCLTKEHKQTLFEEYTTTLRNKYPKSHAIQRIPLTLLDHTSDEWKSRIEAYIQKQLKRGVPSLGSDLASLFLIEQPINNNNNNNNTSIAIPSLYVIASDPYDINSHPVYKAISDIVDTYITSLEQQSTFPLNAELQPQQEEPPSTLLWTWYLRAVLYDLTGQYSKAIEMTTKCLNQTPTAVDVYELQGKIYKNAGDIDKAVSSTNEGRLLDKQDRYINNQTVKYLLQAGKEDEALDTMALFTRHESDPEQNIFDMQCYWYEMELGHCLRKKGDLGKALKKFTAIEKHFEDFNEDQFDFHAYCIRKVTLRAYLQVLRWEDTLWGHDIYADAAEAIISIYLNLFDNPPELTDESVEPDYSKMTPAERKKAKAQARKKKKKAEKKAEEEAKVTEEKGNEKGGKNSNDAKNPPKDADPDGKELLKLDPLEQAKKYTATLVKNAPNRLTTWLFQYDVAIKRKKYLLALQALNKANKIHSYANNGELFSRMIDFACLEMQPYENKEVQSIFESEKIALFGNQSVIDFVNDVANQVDDSNIDLSVRIAIAKAQIKFKIGSLKDICETITKKGLNVHGASLRNCVNCKLFLDSLGECESVTELKDSWRAAVKSRFYLSSHF